MPQPMLEPTAQRLVIYFGEADRWRGKPLSAALLETLKAEGLAGATVLRGVAGFGAHSRIHTAAILRLSQDLPLRLEVIDTRARIARAIEVVAPMVNEGLMTVEDVQVIKYTHRYLNPLPADRAVSAVMTRRVITVTSAMSVAAAWERMLQNNVKSMPVVDEGNHVVGMLTDEDILTRAGVGQRLAVAKQLDDAQLKQEFQRLQDSALTVKDVMSQPPLVAQPNESIAAAAARMAGHGVKRLPVVDEQGSLVGVLARLDVLRLVTEATARGGDNPMPAGAGRVAADVMLPNIPLVPGTANLAEIVAAFVTFNSHRLIVIDEQGLPIGLVSDGDVVARIQPADRRGLLDALQRRGPTPSTAVQARDLMSPEVLTVTPETSLTDATQKMLARGRKWLIVVDAAGKPLGLVDRQAVLRAVVGG